MRALYQIQVQLGHEEENNGSSFVSVISLMIHYNVNLHVAVDCAKEVLLASFFALQCENASICNKPQCPMSIAFSLSLVIHDTSIYKLNGACPVLVFSVPEFCVLKSLSFFVFVFFRTHRHLFSDHGIQSGAMYEVSFKGITFQKQSAISPNPPAGDTLEQVHNFTCSVPPTFVHSAYRAYAHTSRNVRINQHVHDEQAPTQELPYDQFRRSSAAHHVRNTLYTASVTHSLHCLSVHFCSTA